MGRCATSRRGQDDCRADSLANAVERQGCRLVGLRRPERVAGSSAAARGGSTPERSHVMAENGWPTAWFGHAFRSATTPALNRLAPSALAPRTRRCVASTSLFGPPCSRESAVAGTRATLVLLEQVERAALAVDDDATQRRVRDADLSRGRGAMRGTRRDGRAVRR